MVGFVNYTRGHILSELAVERRLGNTDLKMCVRCKRFCRALFCMRFPLGHVVCCLHRKQLLRQGRSQNDTSLTPPVATAHEDWCRCNRVFLPPTRIHTGEFRPVFKVGRKLRFWCRVLRRRHDVFDLLTSTLHDPELTRAVIS